MFFIALIVVGVLEGNGAHLGPWLLVIPLGALGLDYVTAAYLQGKL